MTTAVLETGSIFKLTDQFSGPLEKLIGGLSKAERSAKVLQAQLDRLGLGGTATKIGAELDRITGSSTAAAEKIETRFAALQKGVVGSFDGIKAGSVGAFAGLVEGSDKATASVLGNVGHMRQGVVEQLDLIKGSSAAIWTGMTDGAEAASTGVVAAMGKIGAAVDGPLASVRALLAETNAAVERMGALSAATGVGAVEAAAGGGVRVPGSGGFGRAAHGSGGPHFGRYGTEIPGGHMSIGGGAGMAAAGVVGFGIYEAAQMRDEIQRLMLTGQVEPDKFGATRGQFEKLMMNAASETGFSVKQVGDALAKSERALAGVDVKTKMDVTQALIPYAATEARLKGTGLAEALETMVGLSHMTGVFDVEGVKDLARKFSFVSLATNASLPQFEKTLSYSMPILRTGMGMAPDTIMALTAASQNAGITSTKSGTWIRSFFQGSEPEAGDGEHAQKHNEALRKMGLLDSQNRPTWKTYGDDGKIDWNASVVKEGSIIHDRLAHVPVDERMSTVSKIWGERGGAMASMLSMNTFMEQFSIIAQKIQNFKGGSSAIEEYTRDNPAQKARETWRDFENVLMNIGDKTLPTVNSALTALDEALKRLPADWEASKKMWSDQENKILNLPKAGADALGKAIPGPLGAPFRDQSHPAFDPNSAIYVPSAFRDDVLSPGASGGTGPGSMTYSLGMGVYGGLKSFAADTGGRIPVSFDGALGGLPGWGGGAAAGGLGHSGAPSIRYGRQHSFGGGGPVVPFNLDGSQAKQLDDGIRLAAQHLGINARDLATTISYETAGTMDPWKAGPHTRWGWHHGLIQWGEPQAAAYGVGPNSSIGQQMAAVEKYLKDAGVRPGMGIKDVYSAINAGHVGKYGASDGYGTVETHVDKMLGSGHRDALDRLDKAMGGAEKTGDALRPAVPGFTLPKGGYWAKDGHGNPVPVGPDGAAIQSYRPMPTVDGRPTRKTVSPGSPNGGSGDHVEAAVGRALGSLKMEVAFVYDRHHEQHVAKFVTKHQTVANRFPRSGGGPDFHSHYSNPAGTPVTDSA